MSSSTPIHFGNDLSRRFEASSAPKAGQPMVQGRATLSGQGADLSVGQGKFSRGGFGSGVPKYFPLISQACLSAAPSLVTTPLKPRVGYLDKKSRSLGPFFLCADKRHICATRIGRQDKFCTKVNCTIQHGSSEKFDISEDTLYLPVSSTRAAMSPALRMADFDSTVRDALVHIQGDKVLLAGLMTVMGELLEAGASSDMMLAEINAKSQFAKLSSSMNVTPGKDLKEAVRASTIVESSPDRRAVLFAELSALFPMGNDNGGLSEFSSANPTQDDRVTLLEQAISVIGMGLSGLDGSVAESMFLLKGLASEVGAMVGDEHQVSEDLGGTSSLWDGLGTLKELISSVDITFSKHLADHTAERRSLASAIERRLNLLESGNVRVKDLLPTSMNPQGTGFYQDVANSFGYFFNAPGGLGDVIASQLRPAEPVSTPSGSHPHAELDALKDTVRQLQSVMDRVVADTQGGGVKIPGGHRFDSEEKVLSLVTAVNAKCALPPHAWGYVYDVWHILDAIGSNSSSSQRSDSDFAKDQHNRKKVDLSDQELRITSGMSRRRPLAFDPEGTAESEDLQKRPFQSLKEYKHWNTPGVNSHCRYSKLMEQLTRLREDYPVRLRRAFDHYDHEPLLALLMGMFQMAVHHVGDLFTWMDTQYMSENTYANEADAWSLVAGCVAAYLKTLKTHRFWGEELATFGGNSDSEKCSRLARVIWVFGRSLTVSQEFVTARFRDHPASVAVYTDHMNRSRATKTELEVTVKKLKEQAGVLSSMNGRIVALEKKKS